MKAIKVLNTIALAIPISFLLLSIFGEGFLAAALISTIATGAIQIICGILYWYRHPINLHIKLYFAGVLFFFCCYFFSFFTNGFLFLPLLLAIFLSIIIYSTNDEKQSFMKAEWNDLLFINYEINPAVLEKYIPKGTEIDLFKDKCYISVIGFMFEDVEVMGIKIPYHINFEEVNLRFYVKRFEDGIWKRGVVFVKEIVPKYAITFVANTLYNEQYQTLPMRHERTSKDNQLNFKYEWKKNHSWNSIAVQTEKELLPIDEHSEAEFVSEHYYGYSISPRQKTIEYEVKHPRWQQYKVIDYSINVDFKNVYGEEFSFLQTLKPASCFVAKGSKISIESKRILL